MKTLIKKWLVAQTQQNKIEEANLKSEMQDLFWSVGPRSPKESRKLQQLMIDMKMGLVK